jgi:hypothetical protein
MFYGGRKLLESPFQNFESAPRPRQSQTEFCERWLRPATYNVCEKLHAYGHCILFNGACSRRPSWRLRPLLLDTDSGLTSDRLFSSTLHAPDRRGGSLFEFRSSLSKLSLFQTLKTRVNCSDLWHSIDSKAMNQLRFFCLL